MLGRFHKLQKKINTFELLHINTQAAAANLQSLNDPKKNITKSTE